jgi:hypothetical protein
LRSKPPPPRRTGSQRRGTPPTTATASAPSQPAKPEWECTWTTLLRGGDITVQGPYYDDGTNTTLAITGGTGMYTGAEGSMLLHATGHPVGSEYDFIFTLTH